MFTIEFISATAWPEAELGAPSTVSTHLRLPPTFRTRPLGNRTGPVGSSTREHLTPSVGNTTDLLKKPAKTDDLIAMHGRNRVSGDRGATAVEYAMALALMLLSSLAALNSLTTASGSYLSRTGDDIGEPPERVAAISPSLPDPPSWVNSP
jgi:Flp pilus assembly pilin Flp